MKAQLLEVLHEAGLGQIVGHDLRAGREAGLHPRPGPEPVLHGPLRHQACGDHDGRVGRVGAARDRGDHDGAVLQLAVHAIDVEIDVRGVRRRGHCGSTAERLPALGLPVIPHVRRGPDGRRRLYEGRQLRQEVLLDGA